MKPITSIRDYNEAIPRITARFVLGSIGSENKPRCTKRVSGLFISTPQQL
jgi:hypothetical protein